MAERSTAAERNAALRLAVTLCGGHIGNGGDGAGAAIGTNASTSSSTSIAFTRFIHADFITIIEQFNKNIDSARRWHRLDRDVLVEGMRVLCEYEPVVRELRRRVSSSAISGLDEQLSRLLQCEKKAKDDLMIVDV